MRINGTKYDLIETLPPDAMPVSKYAHTNNTAVGYVYIKYNRFLDGKGSKPNYTIKCFQGSNFVIPE